MHRRHPDAWLALAARELPPHPVPDADLVADAVQRLGGYFQSLEWQEKPDGRLAGHPARRLSFQGDANQTLMSGECEVLSYQGTAYWFATWAPAGGADSVGRELERARQGFTVLDNHRRTAERPAPVERTFLGVKAGYSLRDPNGLWERWPEPKDADPDADLLLQARDRGAPKDVTRMASFLVLILDPVDDPGKALAAARTHLERQQKRDHPGTVLEPIGGDASGAADRVGTVNGRLARWDVKNGDNRERFVLLAVVPGRRHALVIQCECAWGRRGV
jgi:hypothetical protein